MRNFLGDDVFDPGTVSILMAAFDSAWQSIGLVGPAAGYREARPAQTQIARQRGVHERICTSVICQDLRVPRWRNLLQLNEFTAATC